MKKKLSEMSLEELWQIFPIILKEHNPNYSKWYLQEKNRLNKVIGIQNINRISHIGSTSVKGLISKPIIDILLEIGKEINIEELKTKLYDDGWLLMSEKKNPNMEISFNKGYTPNGFADRVFHLHIRYSGNWDELYFRDLLMEDKNIMFEYQELKLKLKEQYEYHRDDYTNEKSSFIVKYSKIAKEKYKNRYLPII